MSYNRRFQQNQSVDNIRGKSPMASVFKSSGSYSYRPGESDCCYYLRTGSCGYGSNCRFNHPVYDAQGGHYREQLPERIRQPNCVDQMKEQSEVRRWDELLPEALEMIFSYLSLKELLTVIPCVCKYWRNVVTAPGCWQEIDIENWSKYCRPYRVYRMLRMLITRSNGSLRKLCVSGPMIDATFSFITENASSLQVLRLPGSKIKGSIVRKNAQRLSTITVLDLSCCKKIGAKALVAIGKHCKLLVTLFYNMDRYNYKNSDAQANAIAATMPGLKHLEMANHKISSESVMKIIFGCTQLEYLNIRHCCEVELDFGFLKEKFPKLTIFGPHTLEDCIDSDINTDRDFDPWNPDYLDYDDYDYTDPFHPDYGMFENVWRRETVPAPALEEGIPEAKVIAAADSQVFGKIQGGTASVNEVPGAGSLENNYEADPDDGMGAGLGPDVFPAPPVKGEDSNKVVNESLSDDDFRMEAKQAWKIGEMVGFRVADEDYERVIDQLCDILKRDRVDPNQIRDY